MRATDQALRLLARPIRRTEVATLASAGIVLLMALLPTADAGDRDALFPVVGATLVYSVLWFRILPPDLLGRWHFTIGTLIALGMAFTVLLRTGHSASEYFTVYLLAILATAFGLRAWTTLVVGGIATAAYAALVLNDLASGRTGHEHLEAVRLISLATVVVFVWLIVRALAAARERAQLQAAALALKSEEIETVLQTALDAVVTMDAAGRITRWNDHATLIFGHEVQAVIGRDALELLIPAPQREPLRDGFRRFVESGERTLVGRVIELEALRADGSEFPIELSVAAYRQSDNWAFTAFIADITERHIAREDLAKRAFSDALTGLPNRALLYDRLQQALVTAEREQGSASVLLMDLDLFKEVNDRWGHECGDRVLAGFAARLRDCVRESDTAGRLGGDEFLVILPATDGPGACAVGAKILEASLEPLLLDGRRIVVRPSVGAATYPGDAVDPAALVRVADAAMYEAKRTRRGLVAGDRRAGGPLPRAERPADGAQPRA